MNPMEIRNQRIIDAVIEKEKAVCPGAVALIGIYGSFQTGDIHQYSDLDLLILINDDRGWSLGTTFIQEDLGIGHDIYCTSWEDLRRDACYEHPHISKLMDSQIVYCADEKYMAELERLRDEVRKKLALPLDEADYQKAENVFQFVQQHYAEAMVADRLEDVRKQAGGVIYYAENMVAMLNKTYYRKGVKRRYEELNTMKKRPENLCDMIESVITAARENVLKERLTVLVQELEGCLKKEKASLQTAKKSACAETLSGTFEEMFSNWHGKMYQAAESGDRHLSFMSLISLHEMLSEIGKEAEIGSYDVLSVFDPEDLRKTAEAFDAVLQEYLQEYSKAGLKEKRFHDIETFILDYLNP